jgi:inward rectifier potassium channel
MAFNKASRRDQARISDPGFGEKIGSHSRRMINPDGSFNVVRLGGDKGLRNVYQHLLSISNTSFFLLILLSYTLLSLLFALFYWWIGVEYMTNVLGETPIRQFLDCFFFSTQTFTTVGYGAIAPRGLLTSTLASFEAFLGLIFFALSTGLMYARFSKPKAKLVYSKKALISPYQEGHALMFRLANQRTNVLMQMEAKLILAMQIETPTGRERKFYDLRTEIDKVLFLALSWTLVHKIDENSPLWGLTADGLARGEAEVLILISGFDDTFNQVVHSRYSYKADEFVWNAKFRRPFRTANEGMVILDLAVLHEYDKV